MENMKVKDLMVPVDRFPRISDRASYYEALGALERAQEKFLAGEAEQRILLVENDAGKVVAKISPVDMLRGLEAKYTRVEVEKTLERFGLRYIWGAMRKDYNLWENPFGELCRKANDVHIRDFINEPSEGRTVGPDDPLAKCFHLFVMNRHDTLLVKEGDEIVGLLRFSDVYRKISQVMKECALEA